MKSLLSLFKFDREDRTNILIGVFITALIAANLLGSKITTFAGISFSVGLLAFPLTFLVTDIIGEVHGKKKAQSVVNSALISLILLIVITAIAVRLPAAARFGAEANAAYITVFQSGTRLMLASLVAFLMSQHADVLHFEFWKTKTNGKYLWLRNNVSTMTSLFIDTMTFMYLAFWHMSPKFTTMFVLQLSIPYYFLKVVLAAFDTPFVYAGVNWLKRGA